MNSHMSHTKAIRAQLGKKDGDMLHVVIEERQ